MFEQTKDKTGSCLRTQLQGESGGEISCFITTVAKHDAIAIARLAKKKAAYLETIQSKKRKTKVNAVQAKKKCAADSENTCK